VAKALRQGLGNALAGGVIQNAPEFRVALKEDVIGARPASAEGETVFAEN